MLLLGLFIAFGVYILYRVLGYFRFHGPFGKYYAGKHIWLIGASSGLGEEMVTQLAPTGTILSISSRKTEVLNALKKQTLAKCPSAQINVYPLDVTDEAAIEQTYEALKKDICEVDVVIYNSGINQDSVMTHELTTKAAFNVLNTNFIGAINVIQRVLKDFKRRNAGHVVTISSLASHRGLPEVEPFLCCLLIMLQSGVYGGSKAAMSNYVEALRLELGVKFPGVTFTDIQPGFVRTPILQQVKYDVPLVMETPKAVNLILKAVKERYPFYAFPVPLYLIQIISHMIPCAVYDRCIRLAAKPKTA